MGLRGSADIFQAQIMDLMASLEFVQAYMDNLVIITRGILDEYLQQIETVMLDSMPMRLSHCSVHMKLSISVIY
jgi:hypothetical protein